VLEIMVHLKLVLFLYASLFFSTFLNCWIIGSKINNILGGCSCRHKTIKIQATSILLWITEWAAVSPLKAWGSFCNWSPGVWTHLVNGGHPWTMWCWSLTGFMRKKWAWQQSWEKAQPLWLLEASYLHHNGDHNMFWLNCE